MSPPVLADLNQDGSEDVVAAMFNSVVIAFNGLTLQPLWNFSFPGSETFRWDCIVKHLRIWSPRKWTSRRQSLYQFSTVFIQNIHSSYIISHVQMIQCIPEYLCKNFLLFRCICSTTKCPLSLFSPYVCLSARNNTKGVEWVSLKFDTGEFYKKIVTFIS